MHTEIGFLKTFIMMSWLSLLAYPVSLVFGFTIQLLSYLLSLLLFLASPVIYLGHVGLYLALLPLRILIKLEVCSESKLYTVSYLGYCSSLLVVFTKLYQAFIYFMTGAVLLGATIGMILHFTGSTISQMVGIEYSDMPRRPRVKQESVDSTPRNLSFDYLEAQSEERKFLSYSTILEEEENSHESD